MNIVHANKFGPKGTFIFELPPKSELDNLFKEHGTCTLFKVGVVKLNNKDQFNKKTGVALAKEKMNFTGCYLEYVEIRSTKHIYHFRAEVPNRCKSQGDKQTIAFGFSTIRDSDKVQVVYAQFT